MKKNSWWRRNRGELVIAFSLLAFFAAILGPKLRQSMRRTEQRRTLADLRTIASALEGRAAETNNYPRVATIDDLARILEPTYIRGLPRVDVWGHPYVYEGALCEGDRCKSYYIGSGGRNEMVDEKTLTAYGGKHPSAMTSDDLVYTDGSFLDGPGASSM